MCARDGESQWTTIFLAVISCVVLNLCNGSDYCKHYANCQQRLELEERQCVKLEKNVKHYNDSQCLRLLAGARAAVDGLQLRKAELEKDCIKQNAADGELPDLTYFQRLHCERAIQKLLSKMPASEFIHKLDKFSTKIGQFSGVKTCRRSAKALRKHCHAVTRCCPLQSCSGLATIHSQISSAVERFKHIKWNCLNPNELKRRHRP